MKPEYEKYRQKSQGAPNSVRIPEGLKADILLIAQIENDSFSGLIIEGLARVVEDRRQDQNHIEALVQDLQSKSKLFQSDSSQI